MQNDRFDAIPIPKELNQAVKAGFKEGLRQRKRRHRTGTFLRRAAAAAAFVLLLSVGMLLASKPALAAKLPLIGRIFSMVQDKVSYKGDYDDNANVYEKDSGSLSPGKKVTPVSESSSDSASSKEAAGTLVQTSGGLTVTVSEANCSPQALYLALCIENEDAFPADFIKTKNMEGYILDYDVLSLETDSYYSIPGFTRKDRPAGSGYATPYYIEGEFADNHTFTGIIRVPLDEDLHLDDESDALPDQFTYYLEISDIYGELFQYEQEQLTDPDGNAVTIGEPVKKHYKGSWNFAIDITVGSDGNQVVSVDQTNADGVGIASVEKTAFEIRAQLLLPAGTPEFDYITVICDADGKPLESQGPNAEVYSTYRRNTDTIYVYVCDYARYMNELKGDGKKIADGALFGTEVHFQ